MSNQYLSFDPVPKDLFTLVNLVLDAVVEEKIGFVCTFFGGLPVPGRALPHFLKTPVALAISCFGFFEGLGLDVEGIFLLAGRSFDPNARNSLINAPFHT